MIQANRWFWELFFNLLSKPCSSNNVQMSLLGILTFMVLNSNWSFDWTFGSNVMCQKLNLIIQVRVADLCVNSLFILIFQFVTSVLPVRHWFSAEFASFYKILNCCAFSTTRDVRWKHFQFSQHVFWKPFSDMILLNYCRNNKVWGRNRPPAQIFPR